MIPAFIFWYQAGGADTLTGGLTMFLSALVGIGSSLVLGLAKKYTGIADTAIWNAVGKKSQPIIVGVLSAGLPILGNVLGITDLPPAEAVAQAPTAAFVGIAARELATLFTKKTT